MAKKLSETRRKINRRVRERNQRFKKLSLSAQRIKVISDVITLLKGKKLIKAKQGTYINLPDNHLSKYDNREQLNTALEAGPRCEVCGIGAIFVTTISLNDQYSVGDAGMSINREEMVDYLRKWFSADQLGLIESAFERSARGQGDADYKAAEFGNMYPSPTKRLIAICENIIKNKGKFVPAADA